MNFIRTVCRSIKVIGLGIWGFITDQPVFPGQDDQQSKPEEKSGEN